MIVDPFPFICEYCHLPGEATGVARTRQKYHSACYDVVMSQYYRDRSRVQRRDDPEGVRAKSRAQYRVTGHSVSDPDKKKIRTKVGNAIRDGKLIPPDICSKCGNESSLGFDGRRTIEAHHPVYDLDHALEVVWLCAQCHAEEGED